MITVCHGTIYTGGEPFARFPSSLKAALWLAQEGYKMVCRVGATMLFELCQ